MSSIASCQAPNNHRCCFCTEWVSAQPPGCRSELWTYSTPWATVPWRLTFLGRATHHLGHQTWIVVGSWLILSPLPGWTNRWSSALLWAALTPFRICFPEGVGRRRQQPIFQWLRSAPEASPRPATRAAICRRWLCTAAEMTASVRRP